MWHRAHCFRVWSNQWTLLCQSFSIAVSWSIESVSRISFIIET
jgi:hypothetical protein